MAEKKGAGGKPQEYDEESGQYGGGTTYRQNTSYDEILKDDKAKEAPKFKNKFSNVFDKLKNYADKPIGTYDYNTGKLENLTDGYMVSFHQNEPDENGHYKSHYGRYTSEKYDEFANDFAEKNNAEIFIGVFDDEPEISFKVKDFEQAKELAIKHNQKSVWLNAENDYWENPYYDKTQNPMKGD